jgi:hypothetical protein
MAGSRPRRLWPRGARRAAGSDPALNLDAALSVDGIRVEGHLASRRRRLGWRQERCVVAIGSQGIALSTAAGAVVHAWSGPLTVSGMAAWWGWSLTLRSDGERLSFSARSPSSLAAALAQVPPDVAGRRWVQSTPGGRPLTAARSLILLQSVVWLILGGFALFTPMVDWSLGFLLEVAAVAGCGLISAWRCPSRMALLCMLALGCLGLLSGAVLCAGGIVGIVAGALSMAAGVFVVWVIALRGWRRQGRATLRGRLDGARGSALATFALSVTVASDFLTHERPPTVGHLVAGTAVGIPALLLALALIGSVTAVGARAAIRLLLVIQVVAIAPPVSAFAEQRVQGAWLGATFAGLLFLVPALCTVRLLRVGEAVTCRGGEALTC